MDRLSVDLDERWLDVRANVTTVAGQVVLGEPKTERSRRRVPFGAEVATVLAEHRRALRERWLALGIRPEADLLHDQGVPLHVIASVMGHSPAMSLATYAHVDRDAIAAVRTLEDAEHARRDVL